MKDLESIYTENLIIGAGVSGLAFASKIVNQDYMIIEKEEEIGGYCRTIKKEGFVWDYAGHFFHFSHPEIKEQFSELLNAEDTVYSYKNTKIYYKGKYIDYPFQFNIHQLRKQEFIDCLCGLFEKEKKLSYNSFKGMLYSNLGRGIADKFLIPYNEKLYACDLDYLDVNAMGRFFPKADPVDIVRGFNGNKIKTYNDEFFYSAKGAEAFVFELLKHVDKSKIHTGEEIISIDYKAKVAYTASKQIHFKRLINTMPFKNFLTVANIPHQQKYSANKVLVFNMGFDAPPIDSKIHWIYYPSKKISFYRVGFYNNILKQKLMSLYIEIGLTSDQDVNLERCKEDVLADLKKVGIVKEQKLKAFSSVIMDPGYVHISERSQQEKNRIKGELRKFDIYTLGRYGDWTYCSLEDCIYAAYTLAKKIMSQNI